MTRNRALLLSLLLVLTSVAVSIWAYPQVPAQVPSHFDISGHVDGYLPKLVGIGLWPVLLLVLSLLIPILPAISPKGFRLEQSADVLNLVLLGVMVVEFVASVFVIRASLGKAAPPVGLTNLMLGALFVLIGNYMGKKSQTLLLRGAHALDTGERRSMAENASMFGLVVGHRRYHARRPRFRKR
jgi:uncharacterized membrane protein